MRAAPMGHTTPRAAQQDTAPSLTPAQKRTATRRANGVKRAAIRRSREADLAAARPALPPDDGSLHSALNRLIFLHNARMASASSSDASTRSDLRRAPVVSLSAYREAPL